MKLENPVTRTELVEALDVILVLAETLPQLDKNLLRATRSNLRQRLLGEAIPTAPARV